MAQKHNFLLGLLVTPPKTTLTFLPIKVSCKLYFVWSDLKQFHRAIFTTDLLREREIENRLNESSIGPLFPHTNIYIVSSLKAITYPKTKPTKQLVRGGRGPMLKKLVCILQLTTQSSQKWPTFCIWHRIKVGFHTYLPETHDPVKDLLTFKPRWKHKIVYKLVQVKY